MRPTVVQAIIGLLLSTTLAGALALPGQVVIAGDPPPKGLALPTPAETQEVVRAAPLPQPPAPGRVSARPAPVRIVRAADRDVAGERHAQGRPEPAPAPPPAETEEPAPAPPPSAQAPPPSPVAPPPPPPAETPEPASPPPAETTVAVSEKKAKKAKKAKKPKKAKKAKKVKHEPEPSAPVDGDDDEQGDDHGKHKDKGKDKGKDDHPEQGEHRQGGDGGKEKRGG